MDDLRFGAGLRHLVFNLVQVHIILVGEVVEQVEVLFGLLALLLVSEYQVQPVVDHQRHLLRLEGSAVQCNIGVRISFRPQR